MLVYHCSWFLIIRVWRDDISLAKVICLRKQYKSVDMIKDLVFSNFAHFYKFYNCVLMPTVLCKSNASEMPEFRSLFSRTFERKFTAFRAIIRWNKGRYFVEFSVPHRKFAIITDISLADTRNFAWNRTVVRQRSCKVLHATDMIRRSCNLHEIYFDNCL